MGAAETGLPDLFEWWDYGDPVGTAVRFRNLLPLAEQSRNTGYQIELLTQIARTESLQSRFDHAHTILDEVEKLLSPEWPIPRIRYLLERGRTFNSAGEVDTAVPLFYEAYHLGLQTGPVADFYTIDAAHMLGIATPTADERLEWNLIALELARQSADKQAQGWRGSLLNNIGWTYFDLTDSNKALTIFQEALAWCEENRSDKPESIRIARWSVARTYRALGRIAEALTIQQALLAEMETNGAPPDGFVLEEINECLRALGNEE